MSVVRCQRGGCVRQIDTDVDVECEVYTGNYKRLHSTIILCEPCRVIHAENEEAAASQASAAEYEATESTHAIARP